MKTRGNEFWQRNLVALCITQALVMLSINSAYPFIPLFIRGMGISEASEAARWTGIVTAASALSMTVAQPIWGNLADRWGRKPMLIRPILVNGLVTILMGFATAPEHLLVLRLIQGAGMGTIVASNVVVVTSAPKHRLGFALGVLQVAVFAGGSLGPVIGGIMLDSVGYRAVFMVAGAATLLCIPIVSIFVRDDFAPGSSEASHPSLWAGSWSLMTLAVFPLIVGITFIIQLGTSIVSPVLALFVDELSRGENAATMVGMMFSASGAMSALSALTIGRLGDRLGHGPLLLVCLMGAALFYFPHALVDHVWQLFMMQLLLGVFLGGLIPSSNTLLAPVVPSNQRAAAFGLTASANAFASFIGPLAGAGIAAGWGLRAVFLTASALFTIAVAWVGIELRRRGIPSPRAEAGMIAMVGNSNVAVGRDDEI